MAPLLRLSGRLARLHDLIAGLRPGVAAVLFAALALAAMPFGHDAPLAAVGHLTESESRQIRGAEAPKRIAAVVADDDTEIWEALAAHGGDPVSGDGPQAAFSTAVNRVGATGETALAAGYSAGLAAALPAQPSARGPPLG